MRNNLKKKSLVTGVAGFIGSHLAEEAIKAGHTVFGIDSLTDYYPPYIKRLNLERLFSSEGFSFVEADIVGGDLPRVLKNVDFVFHLAAQPGVRASFGSEFEKYLRRNVLATQVLLEECRNFEIKKFIFASSSSVYGNVDVDLISEDTPTRPFSPYGVTKLAAEHLCNVYHKNYDVPVVILRYFTVYGPRQRPDMAFSIFMNSIIDGTKVSVFGDGNQTRDFTYVDDVIRASLFAAEKCPNGETINIARGSEVSINDVIALIEGITGKRAIVAFTEKMKGDVRRTGGDVAKARKILRYSPSTSLEEGLRKQVEWTYWFKKMTSSRSTRD